MFETLEKKLMAALREVFQSDVEINDSTSLGDLGYSGCYPVDLQHLSLAIKREFDVDGQDLLSPLEWLFLQYDPRRGENITFGQIVKRLVWYLPKFHPMVVSA